MRAEDFFLLINEIDGELVREAEGESVDLKVAEKRAGFACARRVEKPPLRCGFPTRVLRSGEFIAAAACFAAIAAIFVIIGIRMRGAPYRNCPDNPGVSANAAESSSSKPAESSSSTSSTSESEISAEPPMFFKEPQPGDIVYDIEHNVSYVKNQLLISAALDAPKEETERIIEELGAEIVGYIELTNDYQIEFRTDKTLAELEAAADYLDSFPFVQGVTLNLVYEINYDVED